MSYSPQALLRVVYQGAPGCGRPCYGKHEEAFLADGFIVCLFSFTTFQPGLEEAEAADGAKKQKQRPAPALTPRPERARGRTERERAESLVRGHSGSQPQHQVSLSGQAALTPPVTRHPSCTGTATV